MKPEQEQMNRETPGNAAGIITALLLFLCILSIAYYTYSKSINPNVTPKDLLRVLTGSASDVAKDARLEYGFDFDSKETPVFSIFGDFLAKSSAGGIWFLDRKGETVWSESMAVSKPVIKSNGSRLLVADIGANNIYIVEGRNILWQQQLDAPILNADISRDGYVSVIVASKRFNNEIRFFDNYGAPLFSAVIANDFVVNSNVSPSAKLFAVSGINTGASGAYSNYKFYDNEGKELTASKFEASGELLPLFWFNGDGSMFAAGDRAAAGMDKSGKVVWEKQFTSVSGACPTGDKKLAVTEESNDGTFLKLYDAQGQETASGKLPYKPRGMTAIKGVIAVFTGNTVYFYNDRCRNISRYSPDSPIRQVEFFSRQQAAVITSDTVSVVNLN